MSAIRRPGVHEASEERVLLVTKHKVTGAERIDWWPSKEEAEASDLTVLETRERVKIEKEKKDWTGLASLLNLVLGKSGTTARYLRPRALDQREFFEPVEDKNLDRKKAEIVGRTK